MKTHILGLSALLGFFNAFAALAEPCPNIRDDAARLKCYDEAVRIIATSPARTEASRWAAYEIKDDLTGRKKIRFRLSADRARVFSDPMRERHEAILTLECDYKRPSMIFEFERMIASRKVSVDYRIGNFPVQHTKWDASQDNKAFGPWDNPEVQRLLVTMMTSDDMVVRSNGEMLGSTESVYTLKGLADMLEKYPGACGKIK